MIYIQIMPRNAPQSRTRPDARQSWRFSPPPGL